MLTDKAKLTLSMPVREWFERVLSAPGFKLAEMTIAVGVDAATLAGGIHGDQADRILIATARGLNCTFLTADRAVLAYAKAGHVQAIDARR